MKRSLLLFAVIALLFSCSDNTSSSTSTTTDSSTYIEPLPDTPATASPAPAPNTMKAEMKKMMDTMHGAESSGNNDIDYATMMTQHHQGAIDMSRQEVATGTNAELKAFAEKVIADQEKEISTMKAVLAKASKDSSANAKDFAAAMHGSMMPMMGDPGNFATTDQNYAANMIPHHQSAVEMAKVYVRYGTNAQLKKLSESIISSQAKEVDWLKTWLAAHK